MINPRSLCALLALCGAASASFAAPGPQQLTATEMDTVVAGTTPTASISALAAATGDFALTQTSGVAQTIADNGINNNPGSAAYVGVSAGVATATGLGNGAGTATSVTPSVSVPGTNVKTYTIAHHVAANGTEINAGAVVQFGTFVPMSLLN